MPPWPTSSSAWSWSIYVGEGRAPETPLAMPLKLVHRRSLAGRGSNGTLVVATGDPYDVYAFDELQMLTGLQIQPVLASPREIACLIKTHFGVGGETVSAMMLDSGRRGRAARRAGDRRQAKRPRWPRRPASPSWSTKSLPRLPSASDIHIEPEEGRRVRYRVDGILQTQSLHAEINCFQAATISRTDHGLPQHRRYRRRTAVSKCACGEIARSMSVSIILDDPRRRHRWRYRLRQGPHGLQPRQRRQAGGPPITLPQTDRPAARHRPGHRPDRLRQKYYACCARPQRDQSTIDAENHHRRGPGRTPCSRASGHPGPQQDQPDVRRRPPQHPASRPRRDPHQGTRGHGDGRCAAIQASLIPATWCSARCTPTTPLPPSPGPSTWASSRSWCPARSRA